MIKAAIFAAVAFQAAFVSQTEAHGNIILPKPTGDSDHVYYYGSPAGTIDQAELVGSYIYSEYYLGAAAFMQENGIASLKDYITTYGSNISECGFTDKDGDPQPVPASGYAEHDTLGNSHPGPCEIWCDDTRVFNSSNCQADFSGESPTMIPIDVEVCTASSEFVFYWLALHAQPWQVYINCVALDGTSSSASEASLTSDDETKGEAAKAGVVVITSDGTTTAASTTSTSTTTASSSSGSTASATSASSGSTAASTTAASTSTATTTTTSSASASTAADADTTTVTDSDEGSEYDDESTASSTSTSTTTTTTAPATTTAAPATTTAAPSTSTTTTSDKCSVRRKRV